MHRIEGVVQNYSWGSETAIPDFLHLPQTGEPFAELWLGAHAAGNSVILPQADSEPLGDRPQDLSAAIAADPTGCLGQDVVSRFGEQLPYLLKLIAPARALSLQVHPDLHEARAQFAREDGAGIGLADPRRNYRDDNHKPELVVAMTTFEALCGFRAPRRAVELLEGLHSPIAVRLRETLRREPTAGGMKSAFSMLLDGDSRPTESELRHLAHACAERLEGGSPSPRADATVVSLSEEHPGDPGVATSLLLNPVTLHPGEALFVPAGCVHAYLRGLGMEIMAASDNVLRAGLTSKHIDVPEMLRLVDYVAAPPIRLAPEVYHGHTRVFYAPVDDFELAITDLHDAPGEDHPLPGRGPRLLMCLAGTVTLSSARDTVTLRLGDAAFVRADEGKLVAKGAGTFVQAGVP